MPGMSSINDHLSSLRFPGFPQFSQGQRKEENKP